ncbi:hypothetical protein NEUTE1DRAFT_37484 [Neurospora tetrasperma FGSC 2508]|uniref:Uncharacterized protein n=1 Tax=Neurospora tetrasperma (strain FGSC 2508 / ATCC MYA-4615 / P0657) TaxID=510951 RepID=F8MAT4_NEUT8|nr:uncharacterized protein NEUTE1DRAFT_37484 [Neurospora tetrasperma FGSC 2508]EGO60152.1 hypothetical protein NEUTE1DRAFT_37484 [Neurospora tetrasperma FGSC 2508]EGZ75894.1 hypothetical protein NEUTE2DRAFT_55061 [Neurospora tetrasperma FGSC 2509]
MISAPQIISLSEPSHPLNLIPIPELEADMSNFRQWDHAVTFHLRIHNLLDYVTPFALKEPTTEEERHAQETHSLHAYSLIASKIERIGPEFAKYFGRQLFTDQPHCFHFNPGKLWADIHLLGRNTLFPRTS